MVEVGIALGGRSKGAPPVQQWGVWFPPYHTHACMSAAQGCAFTSQHGRVCDLFRVAHVGVTAQGCASEREIKSFVFRTGAGVIAHAGDIAPLCDKNQS